MLLAQIDGNGHMNLCKMFLLLILLMQYLIACSLIQAKEILYVDEGVELHTRVNRADVNEYNPVVFIPGDGGSQLQAKLNRTTRVHHICRLNSDWFDIWLNVHLLSPILFDCLIDNLKLHYDPITKKTRNTEGVEIRPLNFGSLEGIDYLNRYKLPMTNYFESIIATLETNNGLIRESNMVGAAFDFRKAPNELEQYFDDLKHLIESQYVRNNYRKVTLICHSMGCLNSLHLLNRQTQDWRDTFIQRLVAIASPWAGSVKAISAMLHGDNLGIPILNRNKLSQLQSTFPSLMYLFPRGPTFNENRTLVETPSQNYSLKNMDELFQTIGFLDQRDMWHITREIAATFKAPNVELWCLYGLGYETPSKLVYKDSINTTAKVVEVKGDGDGTVNVESSEACRDFEREQVKPVHIVPFEGINHITMVRSEKVADFIANQILEGDLTSVHESL